MADNVLEPGQPRIGWYGDGLPEEITPNTAIMLQDDGEQLVPTVPWLPQVFAEQGIDPEGDVYEP